jgi:N-acetylglucosamine-6-phosphate deacetylase
MRIEGGTVLLPEGERDDLVVEITGERISAVRPAPADGTMGSPEPVRVDAGGAYVAPGYLDVHTHGAGGDDTMDADPAAIDRIGRSLARHGVTAFLPTTVTGAGAAIDAAIAAVRGAGRDPTAAVPLGVHLEGPYLAADHRGAQPVEHLRDPDAEEYDRWFAGGAVRLITLAPELPGADALLTAAAAAGVRCAVGHSGASYAAVRHAADLGLDQATHLFNGMAPLHHRAPGAVGAVLTDGRVRAQLIADGVHLHPAVVALVVRAKGPEGVLLVSDAMRATGLPDGVHDLGGHEVRVMDGVPRTAEGGLAGSTLTLDAAVRNVRAWTGLPVADCVRMATATPAAAMGWDGERGRLAPGCRADVVVLERDLRVRCTVIGGRLAHHRDEEVGT